MERLGVTVMGTEVDIDSKWSVTGSVIKQSGVNLLMLWKRGQMLTSNEQSGVGVIGMVSCYCHGNRGRC